MTASSPLRSHDREPDRNRFFASCCVIVEPPATMRPRLLVLLHRELDAVPVEAFVLDELRILGGDHRALQRVGDALVRNELITQLAPRRLAIELAHPLGHERRLARRDGRATT